MNSSIPSDTRFLLTGTSGTLGHHILRELVSQENASVLALHRTAPPIESHPRVTHQIVQFNRNEELTRIIRDFRPTTIIHCAAGGMVPPKVDWYRLISFNVDFSLLLLELAVSSLCQHFIYVSTGLVYRPTGHPLHETDTTDPVHPYGASKMAAEILLRSAAIEFNLPLTIVRPFSFTGQKDHPARLFPSILQAALDGTPALLSGGAQVRDYCSVRDIAEGILLAAENRPVPQSPLVLNLGSGHAISLRDLIAHVIHALAIPVQLRFGERPYGRFEPLHLVANTQAARDILKWTPRHHLAHAVWELAKHAYPNLHLREPLEFYNP